MPWFERQRLTLPDPVPDQLDRPNLNDRLTASDCRMALLCAPGGFGKTVLLAEYCRLLEGRGVPVAWLRVDPDDDRPVFETCLAVAFRRAGIVLPDRFDTDEWNTARDPIGLLLTTIEDHATPCLLAIDELERLQNPGAVEALNLLISHAPPNLRIAVACRELPPALAIAEPVLAGSAAVLSADELRFSKPEIAGFFNLRLSPEQLATLSRDSAGWPIALRFYRNEKESGTRGEARTFGDVLGNWVESRLWRDVPPDSRDFLLDIGLFERIDTELIDEVLKDGDSRRRLQAMPDLAGLIQPVSGASGASRLHPLVRDHCAKRRFRETPERFRSVHHLIALALERRRETLAAMRHATEAGDPDLVGRIFEDAGGLRFWLLQGPLWAQDAEPLLTDDVTVRRPRLALARCLLFLLRDRIPEAKRAFELAATHTDGFTRNPAGTDIDLRIDHCLAQGIIFLCGCTSVGATHLQTAVADFLGLVGDDALAPDIRATMEFALCIYENLSARFDEAYERAERSRHFISDCRSPYLAMHIDLQLGSLAMAQGRVRDAENWYARGLKIGRTSFPEDPSPYLLGTVLLRELELERNRLGYAVGAGLRAGDSFARPGNTFATYAAESAIVTELTQHALGADEALAALSEMSEYARRTDRLELVHYLSALRVSVLATSGRPAEAERIWRTEGLPVDADECLALGLRRWRSMEALACARVRLLAGEESFESARQLAHRLLETAEANRLIRTAMRARAIAMTLEQAAGDDDAACAHLTAFLRLYATADYARPLIREGDTGRVVLDRLLDSNPDDAIRSAAADLIDVIGSAAKREDAIATFGDRELAVLRRLPDHRDKQIAAGLGITLDGVRYHVRRIFAKLGARSRQDAVHRARAIGLLPPED